MRTLRHIVSIFYWIINEWKRNMIFRWCMSFLRRIQHKSHNSSALHLPFHVIEAEKSNWRAQSKRRTFRKLCQAIIDLITRALGRESHLTFFEICSSLTSAQCSASVGPFGTVFTKPKKKLKTSSPEPVFKKKKKKILAQVRMWEMIVCVWVFFCKYVQWFIFYFYIE